MPSHDNLAQFSGFENEDAGPRLSIRTVFEWFLRCVSIATLVLLIWQALHVLHVQPTAWAHGANVRDALAKWSTRESPSRAHTVFDSVPTPDLRDWVAALPAAGTQTSWEGAALKPTAVAVEPVADPKGIVRIWVANPNGSSVILHDNLSEIDSIKTHSGGTVLTVPHIDGAVRAVVGGTVASAVLRDSLTVKPVLVLAAASWEGKFVVASLEEYGWQVDTRFALSPKGAGTVIQGPTELQIDTAHYSAVIALDSSADKYAAQISDFVRQGGGFLAAGDAAALSTFAQLMPAVPSGQLRDSVFMGDTVHPRRAFAMTSLSQLKPGAVAVEERDKQIAVAARRIGTGRVLQVGYSNTWRWRMGGMETDPVHDYRVWWSAMVSSIAYAPRTSLVTAASVEPTPLASLVATLGAATVEAPPKTNPLDDPRLIPILFGILMGAFFLEWASRRLRGRA